MIELVVSNKGGEETLPPPVHQCAGAVVLLGGMVVLIRPKDGSDKWLLPKGHIEEGEEPWTAAVREVLEETGALISIEADAKPFYESDVIEPHTDAASDAPVLIKKHIQWFLGKAGGLRTENMKDDREIGIFSPVVALARLTFEDHRLALAAIMN